MNIELKQRWIDAATTLGKDVTAKVLCPKCQAANLDVVDVQDTQSSHVVARIYKCPSCGAYNEVRLGRPSGQ
jgi:Zn finger protein HypA/HybF involved in hydrogenase expression